MTEQTTSSMTATGKNQSIHNRTCSNVITVLLAVGITAALALIAYADKKTIPVGYTDFLVYMSSGIADDAQQPNLPFFNCIGVFCDGEYFHKVVMGRTEAETAALDQVAKDFYLQRFGIDVDDPANVGRLRFQRYTLHPNMNYRNYVNAGNSVPAEGWYFYDGGWVIVITDPNGYTLGGEWAGYHTNAGTLLLFGNYQIIETNSGGHIVNRRNIFYRAGGPMNVDTGFDASFKCELSLDDQEFSTGVHGFAQGITSVYPVGPNAIKLVVRNVLTFGPSSVAPGLGTDCISGPIPLIDGGLYEENLCEND